MSIITLKDREYHKVNVGCGYDHRPGYINVDMDPACNPDILVADNNFSNLPRQAYDEVLAKDVLEHIPRVETPSALLEWADLLKIGGILELQTSNVLGIAKLMNMYPNYRDQANFSIYMFGNQAHAGDFHHTGFTELTLKVQVMAAGFEIIEFEERDHWLFWLRARKSTDWTKMLSNGERYTDMQFIREAFISFLRRGPTQDELQARVERLEGGETRRQILKEIAASPERLQKVADIVIPDRAMPPAPSVSSPAEQVPAPRGRLHNYPRLQKIVGFLREKRIIWF